MRACQASLRVILMRIFDSCKPQSNAERIAIPIDGYASRIFSLKIREVSCTIAQAARVKPASTAKMNIFRILGKKFPIPILFYHRL